MTLQQSGCNPLTMRLKRTFKDFDSLIKQFIFLVSNLKTQQLSHK